MKKLVLIVFGIMFLMLPATSFGGILEKILCSDELGSNASQLCDNELVFFLVGAETHGDCVSFVQPMYNEICGEGAKADVNNCKFYMYCEDVGYCDAADIPFICEMLCRKAHRNDPCDEYLFDNIGQCVSEERANTD